MILNEVINSQLIFLNDLKVIKECYEIRLHLIKVNYAVKDEYEKNEVDILKAVTIHTINKLSRDIDAYEQEFQETFGRMIEELDFNDKDIA